MLSSLARVVLFGVAGLLTQDGLIATALLLLPAMLGGAWLGNRLHAAVPLGAGVDVVPRADACDLQPCRARDHVEDRRRRAGRAGGAGEFTAHEQACAATGPGGALRSATSIAIDGAFGAIRHDFLPVEHVPLLHREHQYAVIGAARHDAAHDGRRGCGQLRSVRFAGRPTAEVRGPARPALRVRRHGGGRKRAGDDERSDDGTHGAPPTECGRKGRP